MKRWLKYLLPLALIAFFCNDRTSVTEDALSPVHNSGSVCQTSYSAFSSELCLPLQDNSSSAHRLQNFSKRKIGEHNPDFIKSGKIVSAGLRYFNHNITYITYCSLVELLRRLIYLCKLII